MKLFSDKKGTFCQSEKNILRLALGGEAQLIHGEQSKATALPPLGRKIKLGIRVIPGVTDSKLSSTWWTWVFTAPWAESLTVDK